MELIFASTYALKNGRFFASFFQKWVKNGSFFGHFAKKWQNFWSRLGLTRHARFKARLKAHFEPRRSGQTEARSKILPFFWQNGQKMTHFGRHFYSFLEIRKWEFLDSKNYTYWVTPLGIKNDLLFWTIFGTKKGLKNGSFLGIFLVNFIKKMAKIGYF